MKIHFVLFALIFLKSFAFSDSLKIEMRLNTIFDDGKNFLEFVKKTDADKTKKTSKQTEKFCSKFDAISGASENHAIKTLRNAQFDGANPIFPESLKSLLLFSTSSQDFLSKDEFFVSENGGRILISFFHRGKAYKIVTDENGNADVWKDFFCATIKENSDGIFSTKEEFLSDGKFDSSLVKFESEIPNENLQKIYSGILKFKIKNGILKVSGTLKKIPRPKDAEKENQRESTKGDSETRAEQPSESSR